MYLNKIRQELYCKSQTLKIFHPKRFSDKKRDKFFGCLDALQDADTAFHEFTSHKNKPTLLECPSFLQMLITQQDAVDTLSALFSVSWNSRKCSELNDIRYLRNKITAHSAYSDRDGLSSSIINPHDIYRESFKAVIYGCNRPHLIKNGYIHINFREFISKNTAHLAKQLDLRP